MELTLRMQEIYFLGKRLNGDHLNYSYIAAMPEISQRRAVIEQECEEALEKCGAVEENLLGELTVRPEAAAFLHPLFFGDYESELMLENTSTHDNIHWMFHREMTEAGQRRGHRAERCGDHRPDLGGAAAEESGRGRRAAGDPVHDGERLLVRADRK